MSNLIAGSSQTLDYAVVDVFAEHALAGNPLAIFTDARGLSTEQMQALARETKLSETTFILPRDPKIEQVEGVKVRIFTVREELPFAGHPTLGTATWIHLNSPSGSTPDNVTLDLQAGPIPVRFSAQEPGAPGVFGTMRQADPSFGPVAERKDLALALGLDVDDLDPSLPPQTVSTGLPFCIVPLRSLEAISRVNLQHAAAQACLERYNARHIFSLTRADAGSGADWHTRMQFYGGEDPATGSASGCAIAYLVRHGAVPSEAPTKFEQGVEIFRPSRIHVQARQDGDRVTDVFVGGRTIPVATGRFFLP